MAIVREVTIGNCRLIQGDCLEVMPLLGEFDAVVTDPPYGIGFKYNTHDDSDDLLYKKLIGGLVNKPLCLLQYPEEMMRLCCPILGAPDDVYAWCYNSNTNRQMRLWGFWGLNPNWASLLQPCKNPTDKRVSQLVRSYDWVSDIQQVKNVSPEKTEHPCQVPATLVQNVLSLLPCSRSILDPFMGSGTTGVACVKMGRSFTGIELDPDYFDIAVERIRKAYEQPDFLIEPPAPKSKPLPAPSLFDEDAA